MLFGQKAKNVRTTVNVNEVSIKDVSPEIQAELDKAKKTINELRQKLKHQDGSVNGYLHEQIKFLT